MPVKYVREGHTPPVRGPVVPSDPFSGGGGRRGARPLLRPLLYPLAGLAALLAVLMSEPDTTGPVPRLADATVEEKTVRERPDGEPSYWLSVSLEMDAVAMITDVETDGASYASIDVGDTLLVQYEWLEERGQAVILRMIFEPDAALSGEV